MGRIRALVDTVAAWWKHSLPGRILARYNSNNGSILAGGLAYGLLFAFFAGIWTIFSIFGLFFSNNTGFRNQLISALGKIVPGLISDSGQSVIPDSALTGISATFTITGLFTLGAFIWQIIGWLGSLRSAVRSMLESPNDTLNTVQSKLLDVVAVILVGVLFILSTVAGTVSGGIVRKALSLFGAPASSWGRPYWSTSWDSCWLLCSTFCCCWCCSALWRRSKRSVP
jgi:membrane protein